METKTVTYTNRQTKKRVSFEVPLKWIVCSDCRGEGRTLVGALREGFTASEFNECFADPESRAAYFDSSSHYHEPCNTCGGRTTVKGFDFEDVPPEHQEPYAEHLDYEAHIDACDEAERRFCRGER